MLACVTGRTFVLVVNIDYGSLERLCFKFIGLLLLYQNARLETESCA